MSADPTVVYGRDREGLTFAVVDKLHPVGHHGQDFHLPAGGGSEVVAYEEVTIVESGVEVTRGFTSMIGWYVVGRAKDGRYLGWAHLRRGTRASVGEVVKPGGRIGLAASGPVPKVALGPTEAGLDYPGTAWAGPHIHTTNSDTIPGIFAGNTIDPLPRIRATVASLSVAGGNVTPIPVTPPTPIEEPFLTDAQYNAIVQRLDDVVAVLGAGNARLPGVVPPNGDILSHARAAVTNTNKLIENDATLQQTVDGLVAALAALPADVADAVWNKSTIARYAADGKTIQHIATIQELANAVTNTNTLVARSK